MTACDWNCGREATLTREIEPSKRDAAGRLVKTAKTAHVCPQHAAIIDREVSLKELRTRRKRTAARIGNSRYRDQDGIRAEVAKLDAEIAELDGRVTA